MTARRPPSLAEQIAALHRRRKPAAIVAAAVLVLAIAAAFLWPPTYRSTATILIEQQEVPSDLVRSMVSSYADQRIQTISQRVMTTENLMRIIDRYGLHPAERQSQPREVLIQRMRDDIRFSMISADVVDPRLGRATKATIAFSVSFDSRSPMLAARVANELTTLYLNENIESRKQLADDTATFLSAEAQRLSDQIGETDKRLAEFKEKHVGALPERMSLNLQFITRAEDELRETETRIRSLDQQVLYLEAQLAQLEPSSQFYSSTGERVLAPADRLKILRSEFSRASAVYSPDHPDVSRMKREIEGLEREVGKVQDGNELARQLADAQGQLAQARERYAADHPDVQQLQRLVDSIEAAMRVAPLTTAAVQQRPDNPAYIQVSAQHQASLAERESLQGKAHSIRQRIDDLEAQMARSPQVEREYGAMLRDLENAQLKYREVRQKHMEATLAKNLEVERKGERFTLIEPPLPPEEPVSPNRLAILILGFIAASAAALGTVVLLEGLDTSIRGRRDVEALLPPSMSLAVLPWLDTPAEATQRMKFRRISMAGAAGAVVIAVTAAHFLYRPLDVLWLVALRRLTG